MRFIVSFLLLAGSPLLAESKTETALRTQLDQARKDLAAANTDRAASQTELKHIRDDRATLSGAVKKLDDSVRQHTDATVSAADSNASIASRQAGEQIQATVDNRTEVGKVNTGVGKVSAGISDLVIVQVFSSVTVVIGFIATFVYQFFRHRWDQADVLLKDRISEGHRLEAVKEAAQQGREIKQIHVLVNSNMTRAKKRELDARCENLTLLQAAFEANRKAGVESDPEAVRAIAETRARIAELKAELEDRARTETESTGLSGTLEE